MKLKEHIKKHISPRTVVIGILVLMAGFITYWLAIRPSLAYKTCNYSAIEKARNGSNRYLKDKYDHYYKRCLRDKGFDK